MAILLGGNCGNAAGIQGRCETSSYRTPAAQYCL